MVVGYVQVVFTSCNIEVRYRMLEKTGQTFQYVLCLTGAGQDGHRILFSTANLNAERSAGR
jgi:hypothetical protein